MLVFRSRRVKPHDQETWVLPRDKNKTTQTVRGVMTFASSISVPLPFFIFLTVIVAVLGCGSGTGSTGQPPATGGGGSAGSTGPAGTGGAATGAGAGGSTGGSSTGGTSSGGVPGTGGAPTGTGGNVGTGGWGGAQPGTGGGRGGAGGAPSGTGGGTATGGSAGSAGAKGPFSCTLLVGPTTLGQWFDGGFLIYPGIDATKWEAMIAGHHYIPDWSPPGSSLWNSPLDGKQRCATNSSAPDRVIFHATQWSAMPVATWEMHFSGIIKNIQTKWPSVKRIELMLSTVGPNDMSCGGTEQTIAQNGLTALDAMPAMFPNLVYEDPAPGTWWYIPKCSDFLAGAPQYTDAGAADVAKMMGEFFATQTF
jgi:hypothetical protein